MNSESSRSHLLIYCFLHRASEGGHITNKLCLADLAGSERQGKTKAEGVSLTEGCAINKSLSALGNVLKALSDGEKDAHIPFRDSKLTRLLQDCLVRSHACRLLLFIVSKAHVCWLRTPSYHRVLPAIQLSHRPPCMLCNGATCDLILKT